MKPELNNISISEPWLKLEKSLTPLLRESVEALDTIEKKKLFLLSMVTACSSLFTALTSSYHQRKVFSNLFLFVVAPPASGKGLMTSARVALSKIHEELIKQSKTNLKIYREAFAAAIKSKSSPPDKPPFVILFLPGNCTSSKMVQHIHENGLNPLLILETEATTLASANKSQYGDFSDIVRKSFHGEPISYTRKFNDEFIEVNEPKLGILLSGTPGQVLSLIGSPEDGTFSRYMFFSFNEKDEWQDVNGNGCLDFSDLLFSQKEEYYKLWKFFSGRDVRFELTTNQWDELNSMFRDELETVNAVNNPYGSGVVKRHGLMFFKMCMVLTAFRMFELKNRDNTIECLDKDFEIAKYLVSISLDSSLDILEQLPKPKQAIKGKTRKEEFLKSLPISFETAQALEIGAKQNIPVRTVYRWLNYLALNGSLSWEHHGVYSKCV